MTPGSCAYPGLSSWPMTPRILATGPESSGTRALTRLLAAGGADAVHRSQPEGPDWIDLEAMLDDFDAVVVIVRGRLANVRSYSHRKITANDREASDRRRKALARIAPILGNPKTFLVTYESLVAVEERRHLLAHLGLDPAGAEVADWNNANGKHYAP